MRQLGNVDLAEWKRSGRMNVFHYGYGRMMPVHYELFEDASHYNALDAICRSPSWSSRDSTTMRSIRQPSKRGPGRRPNVELHMLDDDHQLAASLPFIWDTIRKISS